MQISFIVLLLTAGRASSLKLPLQSRRCLLGQAAAALNAQALVPGVAALLNAHALVPAASAGLLPDTVEYNGESVSLSFAGMDSQTDFREAKKKALEQEKKALEKKAAADKKAAAKAASDLEAKAKKVSDKAPLTFSELLGNSVKQREQELGMTMTEAEVTALADKLRKLYPDAAGAAPPPPPAAAPAATEALAAAQ